MALWVNFLDAIRKNHVPVCDIETGCRSTDMVLRGMLSLKLGRSVAWNEGTHTIADDPETNALLSRAYRGKWQYSA